MRKKIYKKKGMKEIYKSIFDYLKDSKNYIYFSIFLFLLFVFLGAFIQPPAEILKKISELIKKLLEQTSGMNQIQLIIFIFFNNLKVSFLGLFFGAFFGIIPIILSISNGYLLGIVSALSVKKNGALILLNLLPHGIFELPAIFISFGLGIKFGTFVFEKNKKETFLDYFYNSLKVFLFIIIPLLLIAATIEGTLIYFLRA